MEFGKTGFSDFNVWYSFLIIIVIIIISKYIHFINMTYLLSRDHHASWHELVVHGFVVINLYHNIRLCAQCTCTLRIWSFLQMSFRPSVLLYATDYIPPFKTHILSLHNLLQCGTCRGSREVKVSKQRWEPTVMYLDANVWRALARRWFSLGSVNSGIT